MAQRQDRDRERPRRHEPAGAPGLPDEGSPRPMWLKPPPRSKQPRLSWDQIIAGAAARRTGAEVPAEAPAAPAPEAAASAEPGQGPKRRRRRRGRRGRSAVVPERADAGAESDSGVEAPAIEARAAAPAAEERAALQGRRRRGRRPGAPSPGPLAEAQAVAPAPRQAAQRPSMTPPGAPDDDRPVIAIGPPRQRRRRPDGSGPGAGRGPSLGAPVGPRGAVAHGPLTPPAPSPSPAMPPIGLNGGSGSAVPLLREEADALVRHHLVALRVHPPVPAVTPAARAIRHLHGPRVPGAGLPLEPGKVRVIYRDGRELTPCDRKKAEQEVALGRAKWVGAATIRLRYDPFRARRTRRRILERDEGVCAYCGALGDTIDHLTPWSLGGRTTMDNCVTSCAECNFRRGNRPVIEFVAQEGITLRKMRNPVLLEYVRAARAERRREGVRTRRPRRAAESEQAGGS